LISLVGERAGSDQPLRIIIFHSNAPETAQYLLGETNNILSPQENYQAELSPVIDTHLGPGSLAIACMHRIQAKTNLIMYNILP